MALVLRQRAVARCWKSFRVRRINVIKLGDARGRIEFFNAREGVRKIHPCTFVMDICITFRKKEYMERNHRHHRASQQWPGDKLTCMNNCPPDPPLGDSQGNSHKLTS